MAEQQKLEQERSVLGAEVEKKQRLEQLAMDEEKFADKLQQDSDAVAKRLLEEDRKHLQKQDQGKEQISSLKRMLSGDLSDLVHLNAGASVVDPEAGTGGSLTNVAIELEAGAQAAPDIQPEGAVLQLSCFVWEQFLWDFDSFASPPITGPSSVFFDILLVLCLRRKQQHQNRCRACSGSFQLGLNLCHRIFGTSEETCSWR